MSAPAPAAPSGTATGAKPKRIIGARIAAETAQLQAQPASTAATPWLVEPMPADAVEQLAILGGCNLSSQCIDASTEQPLLAYGCSSLVLLYNFEREAVTTALNAHTAEVNAVRWIEAAGRPARLVSAAADGALRVWEDHGHGKYANVATLLGHTGPVTTVSVLVHSKAHLALLISTSSDFSVRIWAEQAGALNTFECVQHLTFAPKMMLCSALSLLPGKGEAAVVAVLGGADDLIRVYTSPLARLQFAHTATLRGHKDWVRGLAFCTSARDSETILLASASQDKYIRIYSLAPFQSGKAEAELLKDDSVEPEEEEEEKEEEEEEEEFIQRSQRGHLVECRWSESEGAKETEREKEGESVRVWQAVLDSVLLGHSNSVYSVSWALIGGKNVLLSAGTDRTMVIWEFSDELWLNVATVGEIGGVNMAGFFSGVFGERGRVIVGHGAGGAIHLYFALDPTSLAGGWRNSVCGSGHFSSVTDVVWHPSLPILASASLDQTTRVWGAWTANRRTHTERQTEKEKEKPRQTHTHPTWHELARPQIHGYDINSVTLFQIEKQIFLVSGADEKVLRAYSSPKNFSTTLSRFCDIHLPEYPNQALTAVVPPLGLSNKSVLNSLSLPHIHNELSVDLTPQSVVEPLPVAHPPLETNLMQQTFWPEIQKLYGHGNEILCVTASNSGLVLASSCKATTPQQAVVRLWDTATWAEKTVLCAHTLSVVSISFSHTDARIVSASRDRHLAIWRRASTDTFDYVLEKYIEAHARIVWACSWQPGSDTVFASVSRDQHLKVWKHDPDTQQWRERKPALPPLSASVTAVAWLPTGGRKASDVVALGLETGAIQVVSLVRRTVRDFAPAQSHAATVNKLAAKLDGSHVLLASCGADFTVRVCSLPLSSALFR
eukprot:TRINITY_DN2597_c0_g1_i2.p1 TRINITY_DN2597_c0_g1~~TRINITY_DN2597_c0_g1_i2.p1  ORF type:complete len:894 (-),score=197.60 TRINITY_DN2597_c0_g1_i2:52-2733(-)